MKSIINSALIMTLLCSAVAQALPTMPWNKTGVGSAVVREDQARVVQFQDNVAGMTKNMTADEQLDLYRTLSRQERDQRAEVNYNKQLATEAAERAYKNSNFVRRGYDATKSAVVSAGSYVAGKARSAGSAVKSAATSAGSYVANSRVAGYATAAKNYVASEYNNAKGVKGVSLFAAKAVVGTSVVAGATYLTYKALKYAYNKAKSYKTPAKRQPRRHVVGGLKRVVIKKA